MNRRNLLILSLLTLSMAIVGCSGKNKKVVTTEVKTKVVSSVAAQEKEVRTLISYNANVEPYKKNNIASATPNRIDKIFIEVGDNVKEGQIIAEMDKNQLLQQKMQLENLAIDLSRIEELYKTGGASKQQLDQLRTQYDVTKTVVDYLEDNTILRSPINGVITGRYYDNGDMYTGSPNSEGIAGVATVMEMDRVKLKINAAEQFYTNIKQGMNIEVFPDVYKGEMFSGKVSLIHPKIDSDTHTFIVEVTVPNKSLKLRPGMYTTVNVDMGSRKCIMINDISVQKQVGSNEKYVFVVENGVATRRVVETGRTENRMTEILSGIENGEMIVTNGASKLINGEKITVIN